MNRPYHPVIPEECPDLLSIIGISSCVVVKDDQIDPTMLDKREYLVTFIDRSGKKCTHTGIADAALCEKAVNAVRYVMAYA